MGIGSISSTNSMSVMQMSLANAKNQKSKNIQNEITDVQRQIQKLSSKEELSAHEKANERKKLQKEISNLNTELKQHQEELRKSQKREIMLAELQNNTEPTKEEKAEDKIQAEDVSSDAADNETLLTSEQQSPNPESVITQNSDGTVVLKQVMNPDNTQNVNAEHKPASETKDDIAEKESETIDDTAVTDANLSGKEMQAMVSADSSLQQASLQGTIIAKTNDGIAILKGEIKQDEKRNTDTERKQAELERLEKQEQRATVFQFSVLGEANNAMKSAAETNASSKDQTQAAENGAYISALNMSQEIQTSQQKFYVSIG